MTNIEGINCEGCPALPKKRVRMCADVAYVVMKALPSHGVDTSCDMRSSLEIAGQFAELPGVLPVAKEACEQTRAKHEAENILDKMVRETPFYGAYY